jgi:hypothetical protein
MTYEEWDHLELVKAYHELQYLIYLYVDPDNVRPEHNKEVLQAATEGREYEATIMDTAYD